MGIKKRVSALLLAVSLSFGVCATDYLEVQALEWAGVTIGLDTALKFLLGLVGVSVGVGVADSIDWTETREQCISFQQNQGNSAVAVSNWWADVIRGKLDTASECWQSFKEWVKTDLLNPSTTVSGVVSLDTVVSYFGIQNVSSYPILENYSNVTFTSGYYQINSGTYRYVHLYPSPVTLHWDSGFTYDNETSSTKELYLGLERSGTKIFTVSENVLREPFGFTGSGYFFGYSSVGSFPYENWEIGGDVVVPSDSDFAASFPNVTDIGLGSSIATDLPQEGVLDIPWENVGDTSESVDGAIDNALENVNSGTWTLDQYWEYVQNITNTYAYDITNNYLLPNDGNNETTEDKVQENVNRGAFVLAGLERVFPFCIPWDIYAFVTLLVADPVAPVIEYPIYNPVTDSEEIITIDFSVWEDQVVIMRYIFDFLLIIGLLLLARSLIGAGGSD